VNTTATIFIPTSNPESVSESGKAINRAPGIRVVGSSQQQMVVDAAIQSHGGEGVADPELTLLMATARVLRLADGPDEVHRGMVAKLELQKYK